MTGNTTALNGNECPAGWKNFTLLNKSEMQLIQKSCCQAVFKENEIIIKQGSPASNVLILESGMAKVYYENPSGKNMMIEIAMSGDLIMSPGAFVNSRNNYSVAAIKPIKACYISFDAFRQVIRSNGTFAESIISEMSGKAMKSYLRMVSQAHKKMSGRLAEVLLYFSDEIFHSDEYEMILSRQELGEMTSMAKECVVRILKEFEDSGVLVSNSGGIKVLDREKLIMISQKG